MIIDIDNISITDMAGSLLGEGVAREAINIVGSTTQKPTVYYACEAALGGRDLSPDQLVTLIDAIESAPLVYNVKLKLSNALKEYGKNTQY